jgi:hypothetical protein
MGHMQRVLVPQAWNNKGGCLYLLTRKEKRNLFSTALVTNNIYTAGRIPDI